MFPQQTCAHTLSYFLCVCFLNTSLVSDRRTNNWARMVQQISHMVPRVLQNVKLFYFLLVNTEILRVIGVLITGQVWYNTMTEYGFLTSTIQITVYTH
jgi:hypothetical protein